MKKLPFKSSMSLTWYGAVSKTIAFADGYKRWYPFSFELLIIIFTFGKNKFNFFSINGIKFIIKLDVGPIDLSILNLYFIHLEKLYLISSYSINELSISSKKSLKYNFPSKKGSVFQGYFFCYFQLPLFIFFMQYTVK